MEFHIAREIRERLDLDDLLFSFTGNVIFANVAASRRLAKALEELRAKDEMAGAASQAAGAAGSETAGAGAGAAGEETAGADAGDADAAATDGAVNAGALFAMGLIDELSHALVAKYREEVDPTVLSEAILWAREQVTPKEMERLLLTFADEFPNMVVYRGEVDAKKWLEGRTEGISNREAAFEEMMLLWLANSNPAFKPFKVLFGDDGLKEETAYAGVTAALPGYFETRPPVALGLGLGLGSLIDALRAPMMASPGSLTGQLDFIRENWAPYLGEDVRRVLLAIDVLREEEVAVWMRFHPAGPDKHRHGAPGFGGEGFVGDEFVGFDEGLGDFEYVTGADGVRRRRYATDYQAPLNEYEAFSADQAWMPTVVLMAKSTYVWLEQLSKKYGRHIHRLDQIPDEELRLLAERGITGLWLIGLWERSRASRTIKRLRGNPDAVASAYSLKDYLIAEDLGGEVAYQDLRDRAARAGLRLASDMVPNHMGIDSDWVIEHPEWFLARWESPFPVYSFEGPDLSMDSRVEIKIEDHYYEQTDAAVVFRLRHYRDGATRYMYHGNDGTTFAWNDTAQLDYSKAEVREHVMQVILNVARRFPIIRFDAAMVLAKRHVQRLWFPLPGAGGSIPSRAEDALSEEQFEALMPREFWREVVDRVAVEVPGTLLLAEAFWLLEGYFVRTLGMHRVYNSAFMNMLRDEENAKYRSYLKKTVEFDPDILKRYVNFMSNPDERTAVDQFGDGDKFFGVSVLLATLPGLPMLGHGQVEGFTERYGMDFKQARMNETPREELIGRHNSLIAPLLKNRQLFAESTNFVMYDFWVDGGGVDENVFAYSNRAGEQRGVIFYNNIYGSTRGTIHMSVGFLEKSSGTLQQRSLADGLALPGDGSMVMAYRDAVTGLKYLRRVHSFWSEGLTLELGPYQHMVLLDWRELQSTAAQPWDRLCDALHGTGVYDLDEALSKVRLRPVVDALKDAVNAGSLRAFAEASDEAAPVAAGEETEALEDVGDDLVAAEELATAELQEELDSRLTEFVGKAGVFAARVEEMARLEGIAEEVSSEDVEIEEDDDFAQAVGASVRLRHGVSAIPKALKGAAETVLPLGCEGALKSSWAPLLAWMAFRQLPSPARALMLFDELQLRHALAETFFAVGLEGEAAWKAAAKVRVLLKAETAEEDGAGVKTAAFWSDPDVRWLAGVTGAFGTEYVNKERFEELICWLQAPAMLEGAWSEVAKELAELSDAARASGYKLAGVIAPVVETEAPKAEAPKAEAAKAAALEEAVPEAKLAKI